MSDTVQDSHKFSRWRAFFFPIYRHELSKIIPLSLILFLVCLCYSVLRSMKDAVVIPVQGAEVIPFIKLWAILPMAFFVTFIFTRLANRYSQEKVFYIMISGYLIFFMLFAFILYPQGEALYLTHFSAYAMERLPSGMRGLISMIEYWPCTLFYAISELWHSIVMSILFWGFANEITTIKESTRFYTVLTVSSNLAAIVAGQSANFFSQGTYFNPNLPYGANSWEQSVMSLTLFVVAAASLAMILFRWVNVKILTGERFDVVHHSLDEDQSKKRKKKRLSLSESIKTLASNAYLRYIAVIVVAYNLVINLIEVMWKNHIALLHSNQESFSHFMNNLTSSIGCLSTVTAFFLPMMLKRLGWTKSSLITPIMMVVSGMGFFGFLLFEDILSPILMTYFGTSTLVLVVYFGAIQNALSKAMKYSVFDATKEMAFIPLSHEEKLKGKAAIDGVGSRFGKSGSSMIYQFLILSMGSIGATTGIVAFLFASVGGLWFYSTICLGKKFDEKTAKSFGDKSKDQVSSEPALSTVT